LFVSNFDASNFCAINGIGTGSDQTFNTLWTPKYVNIIYGTTDTSPATTEALAISETFQQMLDTNWYGTELNALHPAGVSAHIWSAISVGGTINAITSQAAGTAGSFTVDAMTDNHFFYAMAWTDLV
jgi:hypothetical protein